MIVFTKKDELTELGMTLDEYMESAPEKMKEFFKKHKERCVLFNNRSKEAKENEEQVRNFQSVLDSLITENDKVGERYCSTLYVKEASQVSSLSKLRQQVKEGDCTFFQQVEYVVKNALGYYMF